jgi:dolichol-phosphate mannosyltransferase
MAADLQDPPELITQFLEQWEHGYDNVYQVVTKRTDNSLFRRIAAQTFYWLINRISDHPVPRNASDFRLVDRRLVEAFNAMPERNRMVRAMWTWVGGRSIGVAHERPPRFGARRPSARCARRVSRFAGFYRARIYRLKLFL